MFWISFELIYGFLLGVDVVHDVEPEGFEYTEDAERFNLIRICLGIVFIHILYQQETDA
jgi:hypothetical protein